MKDTLLFCRFFRRCWVTFDRSVNIKETCWNLQNIRVQLIAQFPLTNVFCFKQRLSAVSMQHLSVNDNSDSVRWSSSNPLSLPVLFQLRDCELAPVVNRDLCRRVRSVNGLTHHKPVARNDIRLAAKLIHSLDQRGALWTTQVRVSPGFHLVFSWCWSCSNLGCASRWSPTQF